MGDSFFFGIWPACNLLRVWKIFGGAREPNWLCKLGGEDKVCLVFS